MSYSGDSDETVNGFTRSTVAIAVMMLAVFDTGILVSPLENQEGLIVHLMRVGEHDAPTELARVGFRNDGVKSARRRLDASERLRSSWCAIGSASATLVVACAAADGIDQVNVDR